MPFTFQSGMVLTAARLNSPPRGVIARARRTTASSNASNATGIGVLRLDSIAVTAGRAYHIYTGGLTVVGSAAALTVRAFLTIDTSGASATTSSTQLGAGLRDYLPTGITAGSMPIRPLSEMFYASSAGSVSVLLAVALPAGSGTASLFANAANPTDLVVEDVGIYPADTGVIL